MIGIDGYPTKSFTKYYPSLISPEEQSIVYDPNWLARASRIEVVVDFSIK